MVEKFDLVDKKWKTVKDLPFSRTHSNVNLIDSKLLFIGGYFDGSRVNTVCALLVLHKIILFMKKYSRDNYIVYKI